MKGGIPDFKKVKPSLFKRRFFVFYGGFMRKFVFIIGFVVFSILFYASSAICQDTEAVSFEEKYKDKSFIFLLYDVSIELKEDWSYTTTQRKKVKILKEEARDMGEIPISYEKDRQQIVKIKARTITPDGKVYRYSKIQDVELYEGYAMYSNMRMKIVTLPQVTVGSILEYETVIVSERGLIKNAFWEYTDFNTAVPIKEMNHSITLPKSLNIQYKEFNLEYKPLITENGSKVTYSWRLKDCYDYEEPESCLPPPCLDTIENAVEFSSMRGWSEISDWYYALVNKNLKINRTIEKTAKKLLKDHTTTKDKVRAILEYIQEDFRYVSMSFGDNALEPHQTDKVFRNKYGDCKDLSLLCMAMLKAGGIKSYIVLFNNEFSITDPQYDLPMPIWFDHVLLLVEDPHEGNFYIDPLLDGYDIGQYPMGYQAAYTFIITEDGGRFDRFPIFNEERNHAKVKRNITINSDGSALIESESTWELSASIKQRKKMNAMDEEEKKQLYKSLDAYLASGGEMFERRMEGLDQKYGLIKTYVKMRREDEYPIIDDMIIIDIGGYNNNLGFTEKERKNLIFYYGNSLREVITTFHILEDFRISHLPKNLNLDIGFFNFKREYTNRQNEITITETTRYKRLELSKEGYKKVKDFFDQLPAESKQRIVLKKIKPWWQELKDLIARLRKKE